MVKIFIEFMKKELKVVLLQQALRPD